MSHMVESIAFRGDLPWWVPPGTPFGTTVTDDGIHIHRCENNFYSVWDAITLAAMDWDVHLEELYLKDGRCLKDFQVVVRDTDNSVLGSPVGNRYEPLQIEQVAEFFQAIVDEAGLEIETLGSIQNGERIWVQAKFAEVPVIGDDTIKRYFMLTHGHGGKRAVLVGKGDERVVCRNTLEYAVDKGSWFKFKHTKSMEDNLAAVARCVVGITRQFEASLEDFKLLASAHMGSEEALRDMARVALAPPKPRVVFQEEQEILDTAMSEVKESKQMENVLDLIVDNFEKESGRSWWHGYNAVTQFLTHQARGDAFARQNSLWFNGYRAKQNRKAITYSLDKARDSLRLVS